MYFSDFSGFAVEVLAVPLRFEPFNFSRLFGFAVEVFAGTCPVLLLEFAVEVLALLEVFLAPRLVVDFDVLRFAGIFAFGLLLVLLVCFDFILLGDNCDRMFWGIQPNVETTKLNSDLKYTILIAGWQE